MRVVISNDTLQRLRLDLSDYVETRDESGFRAHIPYLAAERKSELGVRLRTREATDTKTVY